MERDFSYQKLLFGTVFLFVFYYGDAQNGLNSIPLWIDVHCPICTTWIGRRCFKHVLYGIWKMKKKTLLNYEMHFVHSTLSHTMVRIHKIYKQPRFIFKTALFGKKHLRRAFMTVNSSSSSCCCENSVVDNHLTHACGC